MDDEYTPIPNYPTDESRNDTVLAAIRDGIELLPFAKSIFERYIIPPLQQRQINWYNQVANTINELDEDFKKSNKKFVADDEFITLVVQATQSVQKNHESEKISLFLNALKSIAYSPGDFDRRAFFLRLLDEYQILQIKILSLFNNPYEILQKHYSDYNHITNLPELCKLEYGDIIDFVPVVIFDLESKSLVDLNKENYITEMRIQVSGSCTKLGKDFLQFIQAESVFTRRNDGK